MVEPTLEQVQAELNELRADKQFARYWERHEFHAALRRAMWLELRRDEIARRRAVREYTEQRMIVGERILRGLYSPNSTLGNP